MATTRVWLDGWGSGSPVAVEMPHGYRRVFRGAVRPGDLWLDRLAFRAGHVRWCRIEDGPYRLDSPANKAEYYTCLVRNDGGPCPDEPCWRCEALPKHYGCRFCVACTGEVIAEARRQGWH